jgi:hypothetical protein
MAATRVRRNIRKGISSGLRTFPAHFSPYLLTNHPLNEYDRLSGRVERLMARVERLTGRVDALEGTVQSMIAAIVGSARPRLE